MFNLPPRQGVLLKLPQDGFIFETCSKREFHSWNHPWQISRFKTAPEEFHIWNCHKGRVLLSKAPMEDFTFETIIQEGFIFETIHGGILFLECFNSETSPQESFTFETTPGGFLFLKSPLWQSFTFKTVHEKFQFWNYPARRVSLLK